MLSCKGGARKLFQLTASRRRQGSSARARTTVPIMVCGRVKRTNALQNCRTAPSELPLLRSKQSRLSEVPSDAHGAGRPGTQPHPLLGSSEAEPSRVAALTVTARVRCAGLSQERAGCVSQLGINSAVERRRARRPARATHRTMPLHAEAPSSFGAKKRGARSSGARRETETARQALVNLGAGAGQRAAHGVACAHHGCEAGAAPPRQAAWAAPAASKRAACGALPLHATRTETQPSAPLGGAQAPTLDWRGAGCDAGPRAASFRCAPLGDVKREGALLKRRSRLAVDYAFPAAILLALRFDQENAPRSQQPWPPRR